MLQLGFEKGRADLCRKRHFQREAINKNGTFKSLHFFEIAYGPKADNHFISCTNILYQENAFFFFSFIVCAAGCTFS